MSNLTNTAKNSIRFIDGNIPDTEGYYIVSYEGSDLNLRVESKELVFSDNVTARSSARTRRLTLMHFSSRRDRLLGIALSGSSEPSVFYLLVPDRTSLPNNKSTALIWFTPS